MKKLVSIVLLLSVFLGGLVGCIDEEASKSFDLSTLIDGQTRIAAVEKVLGTPKQIEDRRDGVFTYYYESSELLVALTFHNGVLLFKEQAKNDGRYEFVRVM